MGREREEGEEGRIHYNITCLHVLSAKQGAPILGLSSEAQGRWGGRARGGGGFSPPDQ